MQIGRTLTVCQFADSVTDDLVVRMILAAGFDDDAANGQLGQSRYQHPQTVVTNSAFRPASNRSLEEVGCDRQHADRA
jgi:hypothetical protein